MTLMCLCTILHVVYYCCINKREIFNDEDPPRILQMDIMPKIPRNVKFPLPTGVFSLGQEGCVSASWDKGIKRLFHVLVQ